jgi:serine/threonine protein kinase
VIKVPKVPIRDGAEDEETAEANELLNERMRREIVAMRAVDSPRVAKVLQGPEVRVIAGQQYGWFLEPYYPKVLRALVGPPWKTADVVDLLLGLLDGVDALVGAGIVHRDIKPENIALDAHDEPVLLDFGVSLLHNRVRVTEPGHIADYTRWYSAPEQWVPHEDEAEVDMRTDLFSCGLVAYELLAAGRHPFGPCDTPDRWSTYRSRAREHDYDRKSLEAAGVKSEVRDVIDRLLRPTPSGRYRTTAQTRDALREVK